MEVFIKAAEYMEIPVRRSDDEPLQKLFSVVKGELNLDGKNAKQEQAKYWKQHPSLIKVMRYCYRGLIINYQLLKDNVSFLFFLDWIADSSTFNSQSRDFIPRFAERLQTCASACPSASRRAICGNLDCNFYCNGNCQILLVNCGAFYAIFAINT